MNRIPLGGLTGAARGGEDADTGAAFDSSPVDIFSSFTLAFTESSINVKLGRGVSSGICIVGICKFAYNAIPFVIQLREWRLACCR